MATETIVPELDAEASGGPQPQEGSPASSGEITADAAPDAATDPSATSSANDAAEVDGRRGPANIRESIRAASESLPEQAAAFKELGNAYFREQAYRQQFPSPQDAANAKQLIDGVGGIEGIGKLQELSQMYEQQDEFLRDGNPEVLDDFAKDFPEGFAALAPAYLERLQKINPESFSATVAPYAIGILENAGIADFLNTMLQQTDATRLQEMAHRLGTWYQQQRTGVQQMHAQPAKNPASERLEHQQSELAAEREKLFTEGVQAKVEASVLPEIARSVEHYQKQYGWSDSQKQHFEGALKQRVIEQMNQDATYKQQVNLRKQSKGRTHDSVASYISSEFNRRVKDAAFETAKAIYGAPKRPQATTGIVKAGTPKASTTGGPLFVSQRPADSQLDLSRPDAEILLIQGRGYTRDGRFVTWRR